MHNIYKNNGPITFNNVTTIWSVVRLTIYADNVR